MVINNINTYVIHVMTKIEIMCSIRILFTNYAFFNNGKWRTDNYFLKYTLLAEKKQLTKYLAFKFNL